MSVQNRDALDRGGILGGVDEAGTSRGGRMAVVDGLAAMGTRGGGETSGAHED